MDSQDCLAASEIRIADRDLPIESSRTEERWVEDVGPVGCGDDDDPRVRLEAVHFDQQLIERLLAFFVAERTAAAASTDGVELVDEDDARRVAARILEEAPHAGRAHAGIHLDEVRTTGEQERDARLSGDRARQERFTRARGSDEEDALGDPSADRHKATRLTQEIDDFFDFVFGLVDTRDVFERDDAIALLGDTRAARDGRNAPGRGPIDREREEREKRGDRRRRAPAERSGRGGGDHLDANLAAVEIGHKRRVGREELRRRHGLRGGAVTQHDVDGMVREGDSGDLARIDRFEKIRESQCRGWDGASGDEKCANRHHEEDGGGD